MATAPISPDEAESSQTAQIPDAVIEVINECIIRHLHNGVADILESEIYGALRARGVEPQEAINNGWMEIEPYYRAVGWSVSHPSAEFDDGCISSIRFSKHIGKKDYTTHNLIGGGPRGTIGVTKT